MASKYVPAYWIGPIIITVYLIGLYLYLSPLAHLTVSYTRRILILSLSTHNSSKVDKLKCIEIQNTTII